MRCHRIRTHRCVRRTLLDLSPTVKPHCRRRNRPRSDSDRAAHLTEKLLEVIAPEVNREPRTPDNVWCVIEASPRRAASGAAPLLPHRLQSHTPHPRSGQNRPLDHRSSEKIATPIVLLPPTTPVGPSPAQAAAPSNPHSRQPPTWRPAGSFLGGFRTPALRARANN